MTSLEIAQRYFELSNASDFAGIAALFRDSTTYCTGSREFFVGVDAIMTMQRAYHGSFARLAWTVRSLAEIKPGVVRIDFDFAGENRAGEPVSYAGVEHVVVHDGRIQHIDVQRRENQPV